MESPNYPPVPTPAEVEAERFYAENADYERAREAWESEQPTTPEGGD